MFLQSIIKSIFMSIRKSIKNFLANIWDLFGQWFRVAEQQIKENIHVAVVLTENIKKFVENPIGDFLLSVIDEKVPGDLTGKVKDILPKVLIALKVIDDCKDLDKDDTLKCIASHLQASSEVIKNHFYHSLAIELASQLSDGEIGFSDAIALVEWYYRNQIKK